MAAGQFIFPACAAVYAILALLIAIQARHATNWMLAGCCLVTSGWAAAQFAWPGNSLDGVPGVFDLLRAGAWYFFLFHLYRRSSVDQQRQGRFFLTAGLVGAVLACVITVMAYGAESQTVNILSPAILIRLGIAVCELLLIENLYLNLPEQERWHVAVPCILLGGLAGLDILVCADLMLFHETSAALAGARAVAMIIVAPLLVVASVRGQRWQGRLQLSRSAVFHSATLILSGAVLLAVAAAGEVFRQFGADWGWMAELGVAFAAVIGLGLVVTSRSARSRIQRLVVEHFFANRYDYRRQWLDCIDTLSGTGADLRAALHTRVIRAMADVVNSPNGALFLREGGVGAFGWVGSWNMPAAGPLPAGHPVIAATCGREWVAELNQPDMPALLGTPLDQLGPLWLAVSLVHGQVMTGLVLLGPPRAPFHLDQEVFDLMRIVGREVATYVAEQRATQVMVQTRHLHDYSKRFAFVAHDIKNVSSQLALLLRNAESHISNPEFQKDMLDTVSASVQKITALLKRLETPETDRAPGAIAPLPRLEALVSTYRRVRQAKLTLEHDGSTATVAMGADAFDTAVTHLLNNAVEASAGQTIQVRVRHEVRQVVIDIVDTGPGMSPEFVRDQLFRPFSTSKQGGSGIGAFQARELLREGGGDLVVTTGQGLGTTMRLLLARADVQGPEKGASLAELIQAGD